MTTLFKVIKKNNDNNKIIYSQLEEQNVLALLTD